MAATSVTVIDTGLAQESFSPGGTVSEMTVVLEDGADPDAARDNVSDVLGGDFTVLTADEVWVETQEPISSILDMVNTFLLIFVFLALGIGIFIIANTFRISVRQRQKEFVLLGAVGAAPSQVFVVVFVQAIIIRLIGSLVGVIAGQGLILLIRWGLEAWGMPLDADLIMTPSIIITSIIIGVIVTVIAALRPARSAALTPPIEAMRETSGAAEKPLTVRTIIGGTIVALGVVAFAAGALRAMDPAGTLLGVGALFIIVGLIVMTPTLVGPAVAVLGWPFRRISPILGKVASESTKASPRKTASTASALMIGVALVATGATLATSMKASRSDITDSAIQADLVSMTNLPISDPSVGVERMEQVDGVASVDTSVDTGRAMIPGEKPAPAYVVSMSDYAVDALALVFVEGDMTAFTDGNLAIHESFADSQDVGLGDTISLHGADGAPVEFEIGAIVSTEIIMTEMYVSEDVFSTLQLDGINTAVILIDVADGYDITEVKEEVIASVDDLYLYQIFDKDDLAGMIGQSIDMVLTMLYALLGLSIVIAALGIVNTLSLSVADRTREIGLLRAIGLSKSGVRGSIVIESIIVSVLGAAIGIVVGVPVAIGLTTYLADDADAIFAIPWGTLGIILLLAIIVVALASILPARRAARLDVLEAIATE
ncbi:FtsX-like permease family protein [Flaviflexus ciconiae]|uniref:FtsX-like permease family protein n=1 Tax=Flaviflexus ciconiae TaxID=2496867 RepID=A0A3Q9G1W4_9ACTO|nr:FtsX-like permease family protein [Flaviflexus ciconiae]AZQ77062.1 FtsX-like permease family protein [Flaviflexus ciconiae]